MSARRSAETARAIELHQKEGKSIYEAAEAVGIWPTTLYKALYPNGKTNKKKRVAKSIV